MLRFPSSWRKSSHPALCEDEYLRREREKFRRIQIPINEDADVGGRIKKTAIFHVCVCVCVCSPSFAYQRDRSPPPVLMIQPHRISHVSPFLRDPLFLFEHPRKHNNKQRLRQANNNSIDPLPIYHQAHYCYLR